MKRSNVIEYTYKYTMTSLCYELQKKILDLLNLRSTLRLGATCHLYHAAVLTYESQERKNSEEKAFFNLMNYFESIDMKDRLFNFVKKYNAILSGMPIQYSIDGIESFDHCVHIYMPIMNNETRAIRDMERDLYSLYDEDPRTSSSITEIQKNLTECLSTRLKFTMISRRLDLVMTHDKNDIYGRDVSEIHMDIHIIFTKDEIPERFLLKNAIFTFNRVYTDMQKIYICEASFWKLANRYGNVYANNSNGKLCSNVAHYERYLYSLCY